MAGQLSCQGQDFPPGTRHGTGVKRSAGRLGPACRPWGRPAERRDRHVAEVRVTLPDRPARSARCPHPGRLRGRHRPGRGAGKAGRAGRRRLRRGLAGAARVSGCSPGSPPFPGHGWTGLAGDRHDEHPGQDANCWPRPAGEPDRRGRQPGRRGTRAAPRTGRWPRSCGSTGPRAAAGRAGRRSGTPTGGLRYRRGCRGDPAARPLVTAADDTTTRSRRSAGPGWCWRWPATTPSR